MTILKKDLDTSQEGVYYSGRTGRCLELGCRAPILGSLTLAGAHYRLCGACGRAWKEEGGWVWTRELLGL